MKRALLIGLALVSLPVLAGVNWHEVVARKNAGGGACDVVGLSETVVSYEYNVMNTGTRTWWATEISVGAGEGHTVCKIEQVYDVVGSPTATVTGYLYSASSGAPGSLLATATSPLDTSLYSGNSQTLGWDFSGYTFSDSTVYWFVCLASGVSGINYMQIKTGAATGNGVDLSSDGSTWSNGSGRQGNYITYHN